LPQTVYLRRNPVKRTAHAVDKITVARIAGTGKNGGHAAITSLMSVIQPSLLEKAAVAMYL
jgi:hypothetical protein